MALEHHWWNAPNLGEFPSLPPDKIPAGGARALSNFLVHQPGKIAPRGGIGTTAAATQGNAANVAGAPLAGTVAYEDYCTCSYRAIAATPLVDHWRVPINRPTLANQLVQPYLAGDALIPADILSGLAGTPAGVVDADRIPSERSALLNGYVYSPSIGGASTAIPNGVAQLNRVVKYSRSGLGNRFLAGPAFVQDVCAHYNRLFVAAGRAPGGSGYDPSYVYFSIDGGVDIADISSSWADPVSGLVNTIQVGSSLDGDFVVALGRVNGHLLILKRRSVWILYGTSVDDFTLREIRTTAGCVDARSVVTADDGVYFASQGGYERFDGSTFSLVSDPVADTWLEFSNRGPAASTVNHSYIRCAALPNGYIFVAFGTDPFAAFAADGGERNWLYHTPSGAWSSMTSAHATLGITNSAFNRALYLPNSVSLWGASKWARADRLTYGIDTAQGLRDADAGASYSVALNWTTGVADVGQRWEAARALRATVDYRHKWQDATPANGAAMGTARFSDDAGATIATPGTLPGYQPNLAPLRVRPTFDGNYELPQGGMELSVASNIGATSSARTGELAIYGAGFEHETGRGRRKT